MSGNIDKIERRDRKGLYMYMACSDITGNARYGAPIGFYHRLCTLQVHNKASLFKLRA